MRPVHSIFIHHTGTADTWAWETVARFHTEERGWDDGGYHFLVERGGRVRLGRHVDVQGAHVKNHNEGTIGVCVVGNFTEHTVPADQWQAAVCLVADLLRQYHLRVEHVRGHRELSDQTVCPGFSPQDFRQAVLQEQARRLARWQEPYSVDGC